MQINSNIEEVVCSPKIGYKTLLSFFYSELTKKRIRHSFCLLTSLVLAYAFLVLFTRKDFDIFMLWLAWGTLITLVIFPFLILLLSYVRWESKVILKNNSVVCQIQNIFFNSIVKTPYASFLEVGLVINEDFLYIHYNRGRWYNRFTESSIKVYFSDKQKLIEVLNFLKLKVPNFSDKLVVRHYTLSPKKIKKIKEIESIWQEIRPSSEK